MLLIAFSVLLVCARLLNWPPRIARHHSRRA